jgi:hypothetical protein
MAAQTRVTLPGPWAHTAECTPCASRLRGASGSSTDRDVSRGPHAPFPQPTNDIPPPDSWSTFSSSTGDTLSSSYCSHSPGCEARSAISKQAVVHRMYAFQEQPQTAAESWIWLH